MKIGYFAIGIGLAADPEILETMAQTAEACGFHSVWAPEHVVLIDQYVSKYPYRKMVAYPCRQPRLIFWTPTSR